VNKTAASAAHNSQSTFFHAYSHAAANCASINSNFR